MSLTAEQILAIKKACIPRDYGDLVWQPKYSELQRWWLVTGIADLIRAGPDRDWVDSTTDFIDALTTGDIDGLEKLCFELITPEAGS